MLVLALGRALQVDGILAVFVAGLAYNHEIDDADRRSQSTIEEGVDRLLLLPVFVLLGAVAPWSAWSGAGWSGVVFVTAILLLRRIPWVFAVGPLVPFPASSRLWMGWFGPIGVAALFYAGLARSEGEMDPIVWTVTTLVVVTSTMVHGATALPGRIWGRWWYSSRHPDPSRT